MQRVERRPGGDGAAPAANDRAANGAPLAGGRFIAPPLHGRGMISDNNRNFGMLEVSRVELHLYASVFGILKRGKGQYGV